MIVRLWRGWTTRANAAAYETLLTSTIFPGIRTRMGERLLGVELLRRDDNDETEFVTVLRFDSQESVVAFAGADFTTAVIIPAARAVLSRFDATASHFTRVV